MFFPFFHLLGGLAWRRYALTKCFVVQEWTNDTIKHASVILITWRHDINTLGIDFARNNSNAFRLLSRFTVTLFNQIHQGFVTHNTLVSVEETQNTLWQVFLTNLPLGKMTAIPQTMSQIHFLWIKFFIRRIGDKPLSEPMRTQFTDALGGGELNENSNAVISPQNRFYVRQITLWFLYCTE